MEKIISVDFRRYSNNDIYKNDVIERVNKLTFGEACTVYKTICEINYINQANPAGSKAGAYEPGATMLHIAYIKEAQDERPACNFRGLDFGIWNQAKKLSYIQIKRLLVAIDELIATRQKYGVGFGIHKIII